MNSENPGASSIADQASTSRQNERNRSIQQNQLERCLKTIVLQDLEVKKTGIAKGQWGCIDIVQLKSNEWNDHAFVLKRMKKSRINTIEDRQNILKEKEILSSIKCNFIGRYYKTFQDHDNLYILMEFCQGGDLWSKCPVEKKAAIFYTACIVDALSYLHQRSIIHRDIKSENVVLDAKGYAKLIDFGLAYRLGKNEKAMDVCGTLEFFAPEIVRRHFDKRSPGYDQTVDLWSLGQMIYFILTDSAVFESEDKHEVRMNILGGMERNVISSVIWCERTSGDTKELILELCKQDPQERLGCTTRGGFPVLRQHRWFRDIRWGLLRDGRFPAPTTPDLDGPTDTSQFKSSTDSHSTSHDSESENTPPVEDTQWAANF